MYVSRIPTQQKNKKKVIICDINFSLRVIYIHHLMLTERSLRTEYIVLNGEKYYTGINKRFYIREM